MSVIKPSKSETGGLKPTHVKGMPGNNQRGKKDLKWGKTTNIVRDNRWVVDRSGGTLSDKRVGK